mmetsp:Transcript_971/g.2928  ORF Transcript_971/g.2928 Transcript_971/m.2928 type:complete len:335 (-) Transcript_971:1769-2773(-)
MPRRSPSTPVLAELLMVASRSRRLWVMASAASKRRRRSCLKACTSWATVPSLSAPRVLMTPRLTKGCGGSAGSVSEASMRRPCSAMCRSWLHSISSQKTSTSSSSTMASMRLRIWLCSDSSTAACSIMGLSRSIQPRLLAVRKPPSRSATAPPRRSGSWATSFSVARSLLPFRESSSPGRPLEASRAVLSSSSAGSRAMGGCLTSFKIFLSASRISRHQSLFFESNFFPARTAHFICSSADLFARPARRRWSSACARQRRVSSLRLPNTSRQRPSKSSERNLLTSWSCARERTLGKQAQNSRKSMSSSQSRSTSPMKSATMSGVMSSWISLREL